MVFSVDFKCNYWKGNTVSSFVNSRSGRVTSHPVVPLTTDRVWYSMNGTLISWVHFSYCGWEKSSFLISISARQRRLRQGNSPWMQPEIRGRIVQIYSSSLIWILRPFLQKKKEMHSPAVSKISETVQIPSLDISGCIAARLRRCAAVWLTAVSALPPSPWQDTLNRPQQCRAATHSPCGRLTRQYQANHNEQTTMS